MLMFVVKYVKQTCMKCETQICINILSRCGTSYTRRIISCSHG